MTSVSPPLNVGLLDYLAPQWEYVMAGQPPVRYAAALRSPAAAVASTIAAHFSPIMMQGALVLPLVSVGMIEASATRRPPMPCTLSSGSTTAIGSLPILHVPTGW